MVTKSNPVNLICLWNLDVSLLSAQSKTSKQSHPFCITNLPIMQVACWQLCPNDLLSSQTTHLIAIESLSQKCTWLKAALQQANRQIALCKLISDWAVQSTDGNLLILKHGHALIFVFPARTHFCQVILREYAPNDEVKTWITKAIPTLHYTAVLPKPVLSLTLHTLAAQNQNKQSRCITQIPFFFLFFFNLSKAASTCSNHEGVPKYTEQAWGNCFSNPL